MLLLSVVTGVAAWFVLMTFLRRLLLQPELIRRAKTWFGVSMVLVAALFALAFTFFLAVVESRFLCPYVFTGAFFPFLILSVLTSFLCVRISLR